MDVELLKLCNQVYSDGAKAAIEEALKHQHDGAFKCSVTGRRWAVADADKAERIVCKAKLAQVWWTFTSPDWAVPVLPVHANEIFALGEIEDDDPFEDVLVATFAHSLAHLDYDFVKHPGIEDWVRNFLSLRPSMRRRLQARRVQLAKECLGAAGPDRLDRDWFRAPDLASTLPHDAVIRARAMADLTGHCTYFFPFRSRVFALP
jgi:hypothetical protein